MSRAAALPRLLDHVTDRDIAILEAVWDHGFLTTEHLRALFWSGCVLRVASERLTDVLDNKLELLDRFSPPNLGGQTVYACTALGARLAGAEVKRWRPEEVLAIKPAHLRHRLAGADFRVRLAEGCRAAGGWSLGMWMAERSCRVRWGEGTLNTAEDLVGLVPDGFGALDGPGVEMEFALEVDQGSMREAKLTDKIRRYDYLAEGDWVLFACAHPTSLASVLSAGRIASKPLAACLQADHRADPFGAHWVRPGDPTTRLSLRELAAA